MVKSSVPWKIPSAPPEEEPMTESPSTPLTPRQEYIASVCDACDRNLFCPRAYGEGCSYLQELLP